MIIEENAELFLWDRDEGYFVREAAVVAKIVRRKDAKFSVFLTATSQVGQVLAHRVSSQMMQRWSPTTWSLTWNNVNESGNQSSWCLRFESQESFENFQVEFTKRAWESLNQTSWDKVKVCEANFSWLTDTRIISQADERAYVINANVEDVEMADETDEDEEETVLDELGGECYDTYHHSYSWLRIKMRTKMKTKKGAANYLPVPKKAGIHNSLLVTRVTDHTSFVGIRLVSSGINRTMLNTSHPSPISRI